MVYEFTATDDNTYFFGLHLVSSDDYRYVLNAHGDVVALVNSSGNVVRRYEYDAFGVELNPDETDTNPYRYCAEYFDIESGTIYLRARYYSPNHGRFTQLDPARDGLNWYAYCANNPIIYIDPFGLENLVVAGGAYHANSKKKYQYEFVDSALLQIASLDGDATLLVANAGWTDDQHDKIAEAAAERGIKLVWFDKTDELVDYINNGDGNRKDDPIESFYVFAHGTDSGTGKYGITFGLYTDKNEKLKFSTEDIEKINSDAFSDSTLSYFYTCRTGNKFKNGNFAYSWSQKTGRPTLACVGLNGRTDYSNILGNPIERYFITFKWKRWSNARGSYSKPYEAYQLPEAAHNSEMLWFGLMRR